MNRINSALYNIFWISLYLIILSVFFFTMVDWIISIKRKRSQKVHQYDVTFLHVKLPQDNEVEVKAAEHMFSNLAGFRRGFFQSLWNGQYRISFEIVSKSNGIGFYVVAPDEIAAIVEKQINAAYPTAEIDIVNPHEVWDRGKYTRVIELKLKGMPFYPIKGYEDLKNDSLNSTTSAMSKLGENEVLAIQYVIQPASNNWRKAGRRFIGNVKSKASNPDKKVDVDTSFLEGIEKKISAPGFDVKIRIIGIANDRMSADTLIQNAITSFEQFTDINYNRFVPAKTFFTKKLIDDFIYRRISNKEWFVPILDFYIFKSTPVLNTIEMANVFHFPNKNVGTPNIMWLGARRASAPVNIPESGLFLGKSVFRGVEKRVYIKKEDRTRHFYIIGQTGTGKSVSLMELARQDIVNGEGVAVIDPHGTDVEELLEKIPPERIDDVIYFDAADTERPMGLNMLEAKDEEEKHMVINSFIALLYKMYDPNRQGIMGPQLERAIRNVMLTAMVDPQSTMVDVLRLLIDSNYAKNFLDRITDPLVKRYWTDEVAKTSDYHKSEKMGYFVSKFDRFVTEKLMRGILCQPKSAFNIADIMAQKKVLLVDLAKGKIGEENSNFLGLLLVPKILSAALGRHKLIGKEDFPNFYLYVDEFQNFATPDFATILSEARKYKLNLIVAHQFVAQLSDEIKEAIFGNVGTMCVYRVGTEDAEFLETYFAPTFTKADLANLPVGNSYVRLLVDGQPTPPFSMHMPYEEVMSVKRDKSIAERIKEASRMKYGVPIEQVEEFINERAGYNEPEELPPLPKPAGRIPF